MIGASLIVQLVAFDTSMKGMPISIFDTRLAIVGSSGLGDSLVQMVLANNLQVNGYRTTLYNDYSKQLAEYIDSYSVKQYPRPTDLPQCLQLSHVVLYDQGSHYIRNLPVDLRDLIKQIGIPFRLSSSTTETAYISRQDLTRKLSHEFHASEIAAQLLRMNRPLRLKKILPRSKPLVEQVVEILRNDVGLANVSDSTGLSIQNQRSEGNVVANRILIHPTSSRMQKNWDIPKYLELSALLLDQGYEPVITVAPWEHEYWRRLVQQSIKVPLFKDTRSLADFYSTAEFFIGNDSGNAHLASCLGVPTFQIFHGWRKMPSWRAGWASNMVVTARSPLSFSKNHWQKGLSVNFVNRKFRDWKKQFE